MQKISNAAMLPVIILLAIATSISELVVIHTGNSAYWGNATAILAVATLVTGSVSWCIHDAKRHKHHLAKRWRLVRKICLWVLLFWFVGLILESRLENSAMFSYENRTLSTLDQWYLQISTAILICTLVIILSYSLITRRIKPKG